MSVAAIEPSADGQFRVTGILDATTVTEVLKRSRRLFADAPAVHVDLGGVSESDSSGLALLIEWLRLAAAARQRITFLNMPQQIEALARISEVEDLLHANGRGQLPEATAEAASESQESLSERPVSQST